MGLFTNIGGELKEINLLTTNVGGQLKDLNSLTANIGGQSKEIFTLFPKNIYGTWHLTSGVSSMNNIKSREENIIAKLKFPPGRRFKVKVTINITDGYVYKSLSSSREQYHMVNLEIGDYDFYDEFGEMYGTRMIKCGSTYSNETETSYTAERTYEVNPGTTWNVYAGRWAGSALKSGEGDISYYNNNLLSFDYSIEFELI